MAKKQSENGLKIGQLKVLKTSEKGRCFFIFTDALLLTSGRGLKFCARTKRVDLGPLTFNIMLSPPMHISKLNFAIFQSCTFETFSILHVCKHAVCQHCTLTNLYF